jgi:hypothetical protein
VGSSEEDGIQPVSIKSKDLNTNTERQLGPVVFELLNYILREVLITTASMQEVYITHQLL